jgi:hypothetical protein
MKVNRRFGGTCHLHFQDITVIKTRNQHEAGIKLAACTSTLKMETCSSETSVGFLRTTQCYTTLHTHSCEKLKSCILISCFLYFFTSFFLPFSFLSLLIYISYIFHPPHFCTISRFLEKQ